MCTAFDDKSKRDGAGEPGSEPPGIAITEAYACPECGYDLRTLIVGRRCPECGTVIVDPVEMRRRARRQHERANAVGRRAVFFLFVGIGGAMLILDGLAVTRSKRLAAVGGQFRQADDGWEGRLFAWPFVHLCAALYFVSLPPPTRPLWPDGVLPGVRRQRARLAGALAVAITYAIAVAVSVAYLPP